MTFSDKPSWENDMDPQLGPPAAPSSIEAKLARPGGRICLYWRRPQHKVGSAKVNLKRILAARFPPIPLVLTLVKTGENPHPSD
jgi:hypothetical protein